MEIKLESTYKGTRILFKDSAKNKRTLINSMMNILYSYGYEEMFIPIIQLSETFKAKVGEENNNMMYNFTDRGERDLCLAPEYTAIVQQMSNSLFKFTKDVKIFYIGECFRGENPQKGRFRQFTQFGVEVLNPSKDYSSEMILIATELTQLVTDNYELNTSVTRGLDYYKEGLGFEISCPDLGSSKQVCGGGAYEGGIGFAIGVDRLLLIPVIEKTNFWDGINNKWICVGDVYEISGKQCTVTKFNDKYYFDKKTPLSNIFDSNTKIKFICQK